VSGTTGATLPSSLIRRLLPDSSIARFVLSLGGKVIETSHRERTLKPHERRAKRIETGGRCQGAGCRCGPRRRMIPHHADPWARCHTTSLADTVSLCDQTHHHIHSGSQIRLKDGRWLDKDGWTDGPHG
jgi:hypothetical protein